MVTCKFSRQTDVTDVLEGRMCLPSALTNYTPCMGRGFVATISLPQVTELEAPESSKIGVKQLWIDPQTLAT